MINELVLPRTGMAHSKKNAVMDYLRQGNPITKKVKDILLNHPYYALYYCQNILKGRWEEIEKFSLQANTPSSKFQEFIVEYATTVMKERWFEAEQFFRGNELLTYEYEKALGINLDSKTDVLPTYIREYLLEEVQIEPIKPSKDNSLRFFLQEEDDQEIDKEGEFLFANRYFSSEENLLTNSFKEYAVYFQTKKLETYSNIVLAPYSEKAGKEKLIVTNGLYDSCDRKTSRSISFTEDTGMFVFDVRPTLTYQENGKLGFFNAYNLRFSCVYASDYTFIKYAYQFFHTLELPQEGNLFVVQNPKTKEISLYKVVEVKDELLDCVGDVPLKNKEGYYGDMGHKTIRTWSLAPEKNLKRSTEWLGLGIL